MCFELPFTPQSLTRACTDVHTRYTKVQKGYAGTVHRCPGLGFWAAQPLAVLPDLETRQYEPVPNGQLRNQKHVYCAALCTLKQETMAVHIRFSLYMCIPW